MGRAFRAQSAIEFLTTYGWAILVMLVFVAVLYYYGVFQSSRYVPRSCDMQPGLTCTSYAILENDSGLQIFLSGSNGLGYDIGFGQESAIISAENLGGIGKQNYTGTCAPSIVKKGRGYTCIVNITSTARMPAQGEMRRATIALTYRDCETDPDYAATRNCSTPQAQQHSATGELVTQAEAYSTQELCGNGECEDNLGENAENCPADCLPRLFTIIIGTDPPAIATGGLEASRITATLYDQFGNPMPGLDVNFSSNSTQGSLSDTANTTDANGTATVFLGSGMNHTAVQMNASRDNFSALATVAFTGPNIIDGCPYDITASDSYALIRNLTAGGTCIRIFANDTTLNCNGLELSGGPGGSGVLLAGVRNVTVQNCVLTGFSDGIDLDDTNDSLITGNNASDNNYAGMGIASSRGNVVRDNIFSGNPDHGIYIQSAPSGNTLIGNIVTSNTGYGIDIYLADGNNLTGNTISSNWWGVSVLESNGTILQGNMVSSNTAYGISVNASSGAKLISNTVTPNTNYGIAIVGGSTANLTGNVACGNPGGNIYCSAMQTDGGGNICLPYPGTGCASSVTCHLGCT